MKYLFRSILALVLSTAVPVAAAAQTAASPVPAQAAHFKVERAGTGRPVILIPGLLSGGDVWAATVEQLSDEYEVHTLTLAGFAGVPASGADPFLRTVRDAVIGYIREHKLDKPVIVGHSLGGFLSFWIAATEPGLLGGVVAVDGVPYLGVLGDTTMTADRAAPQAEMIRTMFAGMTREALAAQTRMALSAQVKDAAWHARGAQWGAASDPAVAGMAVAEMMTTDIRDDVARIDMPVLLLMAGDGMTPEIRATVADRYRAQVSSIRDARVIEVPTARHFIMLDEPAFFHDTLAAFLKTKAVR